MGVAGRYIVRAIEEYGLTSKRKFLKNKRHAPLYKGCALIDQILQRHWEEYIRQEGLQLFCKCLPMTCWKILKRGHYPRPKSVSACFFNALGNGIGCDARNHQLYASEPYLNDYEYEDDACFVDDRFHANIQKDTFSVVPASMAA